MEVIRIIKDLGINSEITSEIIDVRKDKYSNKLSQHLAFRAESIGFLLLPMLGGQNDAITASILVECLDLIQVNNDGLIADLSEIKLLKMTNTLKYLIRGFMSSQCIFSSDYNEMKCKIFKEIEMMYEF